MEFKMKDKEGTEYIVEWNNGSAHVLSYENKTKINETIEKFHNISKYKSIVNEKAPMSTKVNENTNVNRMLEIMRGINQL